MTREAVAIASLMNSGNYTQPILEHINAYLNLGGEPETLLEMCFIAIAVMGFPSAINTTGKIRATLKERGIEIAPVPEATDDGTERYLMGARGFVAQISIIWDSCHESSVIAGVYGQLDTYDVQDPELGRV